jgi:DNA modification methylase
VQYVHGREISLVSQIVEGNALEVLAQLPDEMCRTCVTSPPYWGLRDYGISGQIGAEQSIDDYVKNLVEVFRHVRRVLKTDGTLWLNIGDGYTSGNRTWRDADKKNAARGMVYRPPTPAGLKPKDLLGIPWRLAFALQQDGWYLRSDIIWHKPNAQPESVKDRPSRDHEYLFLLSKSAHYFFDRESIKEHRRQNGNPNAGWRNRRSVWSVNTEPYPGAHFATFPTKLVEPCILAGSEIGDTVIDPFFGSGTVGVVCRRLSREFLGIELNSTYVALALKRLFDEGIKFEPSPTQPRLLAEHPESERYSAD